MICNCNITSFCFCKPVAKRHIGRHHLVSATEKVVAATDKAGYAAKSDGIELKRDE